MSSKGFLKNNEGTILPITRGDLVLDSSGNPALRSEVFKALAPDEDTDYPDGAYGLMSPADKDKLNNLEANIEDCKVLQSEIKTDFDGQIPVLLADPENTEDKPTITYKASDFIYVTPSDESLTVPYVRGIADKATLIDSDDGIGSNIQPVYVSPGGTVTACSRNVGGPDQTNAAFRLMYVNAGKYSTADNLNIGGWISNTECRLLQIQKGSLKPMSAGDIGGSGGTSANPTYTPIHLVNGVLAPCASYIGTKTKGVYMLDGALTQMDYYLKANIHPGTGLSELVQTPCPLAVYSSPTDIGKLAINIGASNHPLWVENGTLSPIKLEKNEDTLYIVGTGTGENTNGCLYTGTQSSSGVRLIGGNKVYAAGGFFESSDETLKDFHSNIPIDLDRLSKLPKKYFTWKTDEIKALHMGTSAQELQKLYPELVKEDEHGLLNVAYDKLSIVALAAIDQLHKQINELKSENQQMQTRLEKLEKLIYVNECQS